MNPESNGGVVTVIESDSDKWWAGAKYDVEIKPAKSGWSNSYAATFVLDISDEEDTSPGSSSPWSGWIGWYADAIAIAWLNPELDTLGVKKLPRPFDIDEEPTDEQWDALARLVLTTCFESGAGDD